MATLRACLLDPHGPALPPLAMDRGSFGVLAVLAQGVCAAHGPCGLRLPCTGEGVGAGWMSSFCTRPITWAISSSRSGNRGPWVETHYRSVWRLACSVSEDHRTSLP